MDNRIFYKLYHGHIFPAERKPSHIDGHNEIAEKILSETEYFKNKLSDDDYKRFIKLMDLNSSENGLEQYDMFCYGFRLAVQLFSEAAMPIE